MIGPVLYALMNLAIAIDWAQTRHIATQRVPPYEYSNQDGSYGIQYNGHLRHREANPILGDSPTRGKVDAWFAGAMFATNVVYWSLPKGYRPVFAGIVFGVEAVMVARNYSIGIHLTW